MRICDTFLNFRTLCGAVLLLITIAACGRRNQHALQLPELDPPTATIDSLTTDTLTTIAPPYRVIELRRTPCYGNCPVFSVSIDSDGFVLWRGLENTERLGTYETRIAVLEVRRLVAQLDTLGFFELRTHYPEPARAIPDFPNTIIFADNRTQQLRVVHNHDAPPVFHASEALILEMLKRLVWKPVNVEAPVAD